MSLGIREVSGETAKMSGGISQFDAWGSNGRLMRVKPKIDHRLKA